MFVTIARFGGIEVVLAHTRTGFREKRKAKEGAKAKKREVRPRTVWKVVLSWEVWQ